METERQLYCRVKVFNIVLYPETDQVRDNYIELFRQIFDNGVLISTFGDRATHVRTLYGPDENGVFHGDFSNAIYIKPDSDAIDRSTNEIVPSATDPNKGLSVKIWPYIFVREFHRIAVIEPAPDKQVLKFLKKAIGVYRDVDSFEVTLEKDRGVLERILNAPAMSRLEVNISYTNNDNHDDWAEVIDNQMRQSNARTSKTVVTGTKRNPIDIRQSEMLQAYVRLSGSNGHAVATIYNDDVPERIDTSDHPMVKSIPYSGNSPTYAIFDFIRRLARGENG